MGGIVGYFDRTGRRRDVLTIEHMCAAAGYRASSTAIAVADGFGVAVCDTAPTAQLTEELLSTTSTGIRALSNHNLYLRGTKGRQPISGGEAVRRFENHEPVGVIERLEGAVAGVAYNRVSHSVTLFRDRFGGCALYFTNLDGALYFASEPKAFFGVKGFTGQLSEKMVARYLTLNYRFWFGHGTTFFSEVQELQLASVLHCNQAEARQVQYWQPPDGGVDERIADQELEDLYAQHLARVVTQSLNQTRNPVFLVSGGLDAPVIAAEAMRLSEERVPCAALVFPGEPLFDESSYISELTSSISSSTYLLAPTSSSFARSLLEMQTRHDQPILSPTYVLQWELLRGLQDLGYSEVFGGGGGDIVSQGCLEYAPYVLADYREQSMADYLRELDAWERRLGPYLRFWPNTAVEMDRLISVLVPSVAPMTIRNHPQWTTPRQVALGPRLINHHIRAPEVRIVRSLARQARIAEELAHQAIAAHFIEEINVTSYPSLSTYDPFWDVDFVEFGMRLPLRHILSDGWTKAIVRKCTRGHIPELLRVRPDKSGLGAPIASWFRSPVVIELFRDILGSGTVLAGLIDVARLHEMLSEHVAQHGDHSDDLWRALALGLWLDSWKAR